MGIQLERITLRQIRMPLVHFFETSFGRTTERAHRSGGSRLPAAFPAGAKCTAGENPFYNEEWTDSAWLILRDYVAPRVLNHEFESAAEVGARTAHIRGHNMARGGLEVAVWDLEARMLGRPLYQHIGGGARREIPCGVSIGIQDSVPAAAREDRDRARRRLSAHQDEDQARLGCGRGSRGARSDFPNILLMADANSAYTLADAARLKCLDEFDLMMIEQPLAHDEIIDHAKLQAQLETPICLDECIRSAHQAEQAIAMEAGRIINIKLGRVGGFAEAKRVHDVAQAAGIPVWCGGMLEVGHRPRAQHRARDAAEFRAARRRLGQQALLGARHHPAAGGSDAARNHRGARRAGLRLRSRSRLPRLHHRARRKPTRARCPTFFSLLKNNRNYRYTWSGQVVSEIGDHFNNIAVFSLALANTHSGLVVTGVMLSRAIPAVMAGPLAGVVLDRLDRKRIMIASDLVRAVVALGFILAIPRTDTWLLYLLSALLMFASPFFTSGRSAILPTIASKEELHTANSLTQTTQWTTLTHRSVPGRRQRDAVRLQVGVRVQRALVPVFGALYLAACESNGGSFRARAHGADRERSGAALARIHRRPALHARVAADSWDRAARQWAGPRAAARRRFCSACSASWCFNRGPAGIGYLWASAGVGLADRRRVRALARASGFRSKATSAPSASAT